MAEHGKVISTGNPYEPLIAVRWVGQDYIITRAQYLEPWRSWPMDGPALQNHRARWRQGSRAMALVGIGDLGYHFGATQGSPWMPQLKLALESVGVLRIVPQKGGRFFENDSMIHWGHHVRDGIYDTWAGMKLDKNGKPIWLGQDADDDQAEGFIPCHYNQVKADGNGIALVFRFRPEVVEVMQARMFDALEPLALAAGE